MAKACYLAMTAAEFQKCSSLPEKVAWMSCHFSPYGQGLSNIPQWIPANSILMLDDSTPVSGHDPQLISSQLTRIAQQYQCAGVLLDFQRPDVTEAAAMAAFLSKELPCPVAVSHLYAQELDCVVLLPPVPPDLTVADHIRGWGNREIWLELAPDALTYRITKSGASCVVPKVLPKTSQRDYELCCRYQAEIRSDSIDFTIFRSREELALLQDQAEALGVALFLGLWQQLA